MTEILPTTTLIASTVAHLGDVSDVEDVIPADDANVLGDGVAAAVAEQADVVAEEIAKPSSSHATSVLPKERGSNIQLSKATLEGAAPDEKPLSNNRPEELTSDQENAAKHEQVVRSKSNENAGEETASMELIPTRYGG